MRLCQRIKYTDPSDGKLIILLGLVVSEDENFLTLKTKRRELTISKSLILEIVQTQEVFQDG